MGKYRTGRSSVEHQENEPNSPRFLAFRQLLLFPEIASHVCDGGQPAWAEHFLVVRTLHVACTASAPAHGIEPACACIRTL